MRNLILTALAVLSLATAISPTAFAHGAGGGNSGGVRFQYSTGK